MHCTNDVEKPYYSGLVDSTAERRPVCYSCGDDLNEECFKKYIEQKKSFGTVLPTCSANHCLKNRRKRFKVERARKVGKAWKEYERVVKRLRTIEARNQAANKADTDSDNTDPMDE